MKSAGSYIRGVLFVGLVLLLVGCNKTELPNCDVSGTVFLNKEPLKEGEIAFESADPTIPGATAPVKDGKFQMTAKPGAKIVRVYVRQAVPKTDPPMYNESMPPRYNSDSELKAEVKVGGENKFDYKLTTP